MAPVSKALEAKTSERVLLIGKAIKVLEDLEKLIEKYQLPTTELSAVEEVFARSLPKLVAILKYELKLAGYADQRFLDKNVLSLAAEVAKGWTFDNIIGTDE